MTTCSITLRPGVNVIKSFGARAEQLDDFNGCQKLAKKAQNENDLPQNLKPEIFSAIVDEV